MPPAAPPTRKSKRTAEEAAEPTAEEDEAKPSIIKKPRKDIAAKAAAEEEKEKAEAAAKDVKMEEVKPDIAQPPPIIYKEEEDLEDQDDGAVIPEESDQSWNQHLFDLLMYKHQYKTLHVQATYDGPLQQWADIQRKLYRRHKKDPSTVSDATKKRILALDAVNFPFTLRGAAHWDRYFTKLQEFQAKHGRKYNMIQAKMVLQKYSLFVTLTILIQSPFTYIQTVWFLACVNLLDWATG